MEKQMLLGRPSCPHSQVAHHLRAASRAAIFIAVVALWALLSWHYLTSHGEPRPRNTESEFRVYPGESIRWRPCGDDGGAITDLECGTVDVPMDHFAAAPRTDGTPKIFTVPLMRMRGRGGRSAQNLLLSPGGPGASGVAFMRSAAAGGATALRRLVGDGFHLVAFDARGVGASTPPTTCYVSEASREQLRPRRATSDLIRDSPYLYAWSANYGRACLDNAGEHLAYVNTPQTAADLNVVLDALGQKGMVYWGVGYGALLGEVYASMFPGRVERMVLDAVPDQWAWFDELLDTKRYADADAVVDGFFAECVRAGEAACALARFGKTGPALRDNVTAVINSLYLNPKSVYVNGSVYGIVDDFAARITGLFREMHTPAHWPALARRLADLQQGNATSMFLAYGRDQDDLREAGLAVQLTDGRSGPAAWPQPRMRLLEKLLLYFDRRRPAIGEARALHVKQQWPVPRMHAYEPPRNKVKTRAPVLVLAATQDPAWPLKVARRVQEVFEGAQLVALDAYGHGSVALPSLCVVEYLRGYLVNGSLPEENVVCKRDAEYFPGGEEKATAYSLEEREVLAAQSHYDPEYRLALINWTGFRPSDLIRGNLHFTMPQRTTITDDAVLRLLAAADAVPKPIGRIARSGEGGEHLVWIIDDAFVLRVPADGQDSGLLVQEAALWEILNSVEPAFTALPTCLGVGVWEEEGKRRYGLYRKLAGVSTENSPHSVNAATEEGLIELLLLLTKTPTDKVRGIGVADAEPVDLLERRRLALEAWQRLCDKGHLENLADDVNISQALKISETATNTPHAPGLLHADLKGEHLFVDPATGRLTGVIDWSDACIGDPSVDVHGLAISVGAAAAARIAARAGYGGDVVARGTCAARCEAVMCLDKIVREQDDSPEWLVRRQLHRALERVDGLDW